MTRKATRAYFQRQQPFFPEQARQIEYYLELNSPTREQLFTIAGLVTYRDVLNSDKTSDGYKWLATLRFRIWETLNVVTVRIPHVKSGKLERAVAVYYDGDINSEPVQYVLNILVNAFFLSPVVLIPDRHNGKKVTLFNQSASFDGGSKRVNFNLLIGDIFVPRLLLSFVPRDSVRLRLELLGSGFGLTPYDEAYLVDEERHASYELK